jgi:hypothetical protein
MVHMVLESEPCNGNAPHTWGLHLLRQQRARTLTSVYDSLVTLPLGYLGDMCLSGAGADKYKL